MRSILHDSNSTAQWLNLVKEAQAKILINLEEELEHYLVFLLIRFMTQTVILQEPIALDFLSHYTERNRIPSQNIREQLQAIGDRCLIVSGFFPGRPERRGIKLSYYINLGKTAYRSLSGVDPLYLHLALRFTSMMDVLLSLRSYTGPNLEISQAIDLIRNTHSYYAYQLLHEHLKNRPH